MGPISSKHKFYITVAKPVLEMVKAEAIKNGMKLDAVGGQVPSQVEYQGVTFGLRYMQWASTLWITILGKTGLAAIRTDKQIENTVREEFAKYLIKADNGKKPGGTDDA